MSGKVSDPWISGGHDIDDVNEKIIQPTGVDECPSSLSIYLFEKLLEDHPCLRSYNPVMCTKHQRANRPPPGKVALYLAYFTHSNLRLPLTLFYMKVLAHYKIGLAQVQPAGAGKVMLFKLIMAALKLPPSLYIFRTLFKLSTTGDWFTFAFRDASMSLMTNAPHNIKYWRLDYFFVDATFIPAEKSSLLEWRDMSHKKVTSRINKKVNELPEKHLVNPEHLDQLKGVSVPCRSYAGYEGILVLARISQDWEENTIPVIVEKSTRKRMGLLDGIGADFSKFEILRARKKNAPVETPAPVETEQPSQPPPSSHAEDIDTSHGLSFSPERDADAGFDARSADHLISTEEETDRTLATFFNNTPPSAHAIEGSSALPLCLAENVQDSLIVATSVGEKRPRDVDVCDSSNKQPKTLSAPLASSGAQYHFSWWCRFFLYCIAFSPWLYFKGLSCFIFVLHYSRAVG